MRFTENIDKNIHADFLPRRYLDPLKRMLPFYVLSLLCVVGGLQLQQWFSVQAISVAAFVLISTVSAYLYYQLQQSNDLAMANDFQIMLFAGAASLGSTFCLFVRQDGYVVYANDGARKMFPAFSKSKYHTFQGLLQEGVVTAQEESQLFSALANGHKDNLIIEMQDSKNQSMRLMMTVQPLQRPPGYFVIHGRPFSEERKGKHKLPKNLGNTSIEKIEALLDGLPISVYVTSNSGIIEYMNPSLETLLGYEPHSFTIKSQTLQALVFHADGFEAGEFEMIDFSGNVMFARRNQSLLQATLLQQKIYNPDGTVSGVFGIVTVGGEQ